MFISPEQADEQNHVLSEKARLHLEKYNFPVEMMVALPNGTIVRILLILSLPQLMKHSQILFRGIPFKPKSKN